MEYFIFKKLIAFRKELSTHRLVYKHFTLGWRVVLLYSTWLYTGIFSFLIFYFRSLPQIPIYAGLGLAPVFLWGWVLRKKIRQVVVNKLDVREEDWEQMGLDFIRMRRLDTFLTECNQNYSAVVLNMATMVQRDSTSTGYRLKSPAVFLPLLVAIGVAAVGSLIAQENTDEAMQFLWYLTGILLAIASTVITMEWMISQAVREHRMHLRKALLRALNDCYILYSAQERE